MVRRLLLFVVLAAGLDGFGTVKLLQHHDPGKVVGEGHGAHGQLEVRLLFDFGRDAEGRTDEEAGRAFAGQLHFLHLLGKGFAAEGLTLRREDAQPRTLGDLAEDQ